MSFKYVNPGYAALLSETNTYTVQYADTVAINKSKTGVCFNGRNNFKINLGDIGAISDIWVRFDCYIEDIGDEEATPLFRLVLTFPKSDYGFEVVFSIYKRDYTGDDIFSYDVTITPPEFINSLINQSNTSAEEIKNLTGLKLDAVNRIWAHFHFDSTSGYIGGSFQLQINGREIISAQGRSTFNSYKNSESRLIFIGDAKNGDVPISNIIVSDEYIDPNEKIIPLIIDETKSTMTTLEGRLYRAERVGQKVLQSADALSLADIYGADSKVTGVFMAGYPAYADSGSETLTAISTFGTDTTMHGVYNLSDATDTLIFSAWNTASDMTVADLNGVSFGWRAGGYFEL